MLDMLIELSYGCVLANHDNGFFSGQSCDFKFVVGLTDATADLQQ